VSWENSAGHTEENHASNGCRREQCIFVKLFVSGTDRNDRKLKKTQTSTHNNHSPDSDREEGGRQRSNSTERAFVGSSSIEMLLHAFLLHHTKISLAHTKHIPAPESSHFREPNVSNEQERYMKVMLLRCQKAT
jgi:hypothetical protein